MSSEDTVIAQKFPDAASFHTIRVNHPAGWFYTTDSLRKSLRRLGEVWQRNDQLPWFHGDIILLGTVTANLQPCFDALTETDLISEAPVPP